MRSAFAVLLLLGACGGPLSDGEEESALVGKVPKQCATICSFQSSCAATCFGLDLDDPMTCGAFGKCAELDFDGDGVKNSVDNCPMLKNPSQTDCDGDGKGDVCDEADGRWVASGRKVCAAPSGPQHTLVVVEYDVLTDASSCGSPPKEMVTRSLSVDCPGDSPITCCARMAASVESVDALCAPVATGGIGCSMLK